MIPLNTIPAHQPVSNELLEKKKNLDERDLVSAVFRQSKPETPPLISDFRRVFQTSDLMKTKFTQFLQTIFYQLDEKKVFSLMENLLADPSKNDEEVYKELLAKINAAKKKAPIFSQLWSLYVLKDGMGKQAAQLTKDFCKESFHDYMEIYDRRYVNTIRKAAKIPLDGNVIAVSNTAEVNLSDRIQAGSTFSTYPYKQHEPLNDADCTDPFLYPEKTHKEISNQITDNSVDMIACLGGLHHIPASRVDNFVGSLHKKLRPGGVILLRDHNVTDHSGTNGLASEDLKAIAAVVHTFVNASDGVKWEVEKKEIREFKSAKEWTQLMENHGFKRISNQELVLKDDPTENAMFAFVKAPTSLEELRQAISYRNDCKRPKEGSRATWIEWGNVRFSKQYAEYIQNHHAYAFDYVGHLRQHWKHFYNFLTESVKDPEINLKDLIFSDNMAMNLFILTAATTQCSISSLMNLPEVLAANWNYGENWRNVVSLSELEKFQTYYENEYSNFIDYTPFYMYDYLGKMKEMINVVRKSQESFTTKFMSSLSAAASSVGFLAKTIVCAPVRSFYTSEANQEPDTIKILIKDPHQELKHVMQQWEREKDVLHDSNNKIVVIHETADGYKLVSLPRYRPFTKICGYLSQTQNLEILEIGSQKEISVDVLLGQKVPTPQVDGAKAIYEMEKLQDEEKRRYVTYQVNVSALKLFERAVDVKNIDYIHE